MKKMFLGMAIELFAVALVLCAHRVEGIALLIAIVGLGFVIAGYRE